MSWRDLFHNRWVKLAFWSLLYIMWVIWLGNYWWLFGLVPLFDGHITKKVKWLFWKRDIKKGEKPSAILEWVDALIFALVFVTFVNTFFYQAFKIPSSSMESTLYTGDHLFVSKLAFGPKMPQTPLTIPFTHNVLGSKESYSTLIQNDYKRLKGFRNVRRGDCVVFNFPDGDTVLAKAPAEDYYAACRQYGKDAVIEAYGPVIVRPKDKKDHYVKRCVAVAGDTLEVKDGFVWVNGQKQEVWPGVQYTWNVKTNGTRINEKTLEKLGLHRDHYYEDFPGYLNVALTENQREELAKCTNVVEMIPNIDVYPPDFPDSYLMIFPFSENYRWTRDNFGPLWIPSKGARVALDLESLPLYERIIRDYEGHRLEIREDSILIDGAPATEYVFEQDYYFMMGDNRHNSLDSRYWGFVPEDHIVGRPALIWLSICRDRRFPHNIRWNRFLKFV